MRERFTWTTWSWQAAPVGLQSGHEALQHGQLLEQGFSSQRSHSRLLPRMLLLLYSKS